jgi:hypothetical protein
MANGREDEPQPSGPSLPPILGLDSTPWMTAESLAVQLPGGRPQPPRGVSALRFISSAFSFSDRSRRITSPGNLNRLGCERIEGVGRAPDAEP